MSCVKQRECANSHLMDWLYNDVSQVQEYELYKHDLLDENLGHVIPDDDLFLTKEDVAQLGLEFNLDFAGDEENYENLEDIKQKFATTNPRLYNKIITTLAFLYNCCMIGRLESIEKLLVEYGYQGEFVTPEQFARRQQAHKEAEDKMNRQRTLEAQEFVRSKLNDQINQQWTFENYLSSQHDSFIRNLIDCVCVEYNDQKKKQRENNIVGYNVYVESAMRSLGYSGELPSNYYHGSVGDKQQWLPMYDYINKQPYEAALQFYNLTNDPSLDLSQTHKWSEYSIAVARQAQN